MNELRETDDVWEKCCQLVFRRPTGHKMNLPTDASFQAAGYAALTEDDLNQKHMPTRKTNAPVTYGSQKFKQS